MNKRSIILLLTLTVFCGIIGGLFAQENPEKLKQKAFDWIEKNKTLLDNTSFKIWEFAETAFREYKSSKLLARVLEKKGFKVTRNLSGISTAFLAEFGSGKPVIGILGEFDALPGLSQKAGVAEKDPLKPGAPGHGCGHNLLGVAGAGAALAAKAALQNSGIQGTVKFFGCPAEEAGGGKDRKEVEKLYQRVLKIAEGAALMTETEYQVFMEEGLYDYIPNRPLAGLPEASPIKNKKI